MTEYEQVYYSVYGKYIRAYMMLCEWIFGEQPIAEEIEEKTVELLRDIGDAPLRMILVRFKALSRRVSAGETINPREELTAIDRMAIEHEGPQRYKSIAAEAYKAYVIRAANGCYQTLQSDALVRSFVTGILTAEFFERHPLGAHYNGTSPAEYEARLRKVRLFFEPYVENMVVQIVKLESMQSLRKMPKNRANAHDFVHLDISMVIESQDDE